MGRLMVALCAGLVAGGCAGPEQLPSAPAVALAPLEQAAAAQAAEVVTVNMLTIAAAQQDVVCRDTRRPGSRIRAGQDCRVRSSPTGVTPEALRQFDAELKRRGHTGDQVNPDLSAL